MYEIIGFRKYIESKKELPSYSQDTVYYRQVCILVDILDTKTGEVKTVGREQLRNIVLAGIVPQGVSLHSNVIGIEICDRLKKIYAKDVLLGLNKGMKITKGLSLKKVSSDISGRVEIPNYIRYLENYAFAGCNMIESVILNKNIDNIGRGVFAYCSSLKSILFESEYIDELDEYCFKECRELESIKLPEVRIIQNGIFSDCEKLKSIVIPDTVEYFGSHVFNNCFELQNVLIGSGVSGIGSYVFSYCESLSNIYIPKNVKYIDSTAFNKAGIISITIDGDIDNIESHTFSSCKNLDRVVIRGNTRSIGKNVFAGTNLESIYLPEFLLRVDDEAFRDCIMLRKIRIPRNVDSIGKNVFTNCCSLRVIEVYKDTSLDCGKLLEGNNAKISYYR